MKIAKLFVLVIALLMGGITMTGCGSLRKQTHSEETLTICDTCGEVEGTDACCAEGATWCRQCGLHKESPGCCKIEKGGGPQPVCGDCGEIKDTEDCCDANAKRCARCGKIKHSLGCCK